jgi:predicted RecA/RadA family phage recombinase
MKNYVQLGDNLTLPAPYTVVSGAPALIGTIVGVASTDAATGEDCSFVRVGVFNLPKATGQVWTAGAKLYFDAAAKNFTTTVGSNVAAGAAASNAASGDASGAVLLTGQVA